MDLTEMLANLMLDLKMTLDSEISTAEATRCIVRAVDDMSRTLPRERIYEHTWVEAVTDDSFVTPAATNDDAIVTSTNGALVDTEDGDPLTLTTTWMDVPRPVIVTLVDDNDSILRMTVTVKGTDADGMYREERFCRPDFVPITGTGDKVQTGKIYFLTISEVEVSEISGSDTNDTLEVGTSVGAGIWVQLDNPVEPGSESIYSAASKAGTKYTLDKDYRMDYANGRIQIITTMVAGTTYYANYDRAPCHIDISSIIPELIRVTKVLYPADKIPEQSVAHTIWENMLTLGSPRPGESQSAMTDKEHIAIYYEARHTPPTDVAPGSYPEHLDQVVLIGAAGYALLVEALQYELQAVTDLGEMRTTLGYLGIGGVDSTAGTLVYKAVDDALDKVTEYLETNVLSTGADNADAILIRITTDKAQLREAISKATTGALEVMNSYLASVATADLDLATYGATALISTGQPLINQLNDGGPTVPERYADFSRTVVARAQARVQAAMGFAQEAQLRLSNLRSYIEQAGAWMRMGETFIAEASQRVAELNGYLAEAAQYLEASNVDMVLSDRFRAEGQLRLAEFHTILASKAEYRKRVVSVPVRQPA